MSGTRFIRVTRAFAPLNFRAQHRRAFGSTPAHFESRAIPRIISPSLWTAILPKFLRERKSGVPGAGQPKGWNPATYFIIMAILIGSQAIRIFTLRNEYNNFVRTTDARIRALKEVIDKINRGEEVDVRGLLGTGNPEAEAEWQESECFWLYMTPDRTQSLTLYFSNR